MLFDVFCCFPFLPLDVLYFNVPDAQLMYVNNRLMHAGREPGEEWDKGLSYEQHICTHTNTKYSDKEIEIKNTRRQQNISTKHVHTNNPIQEGVLPLMRA